MREAIREYLSRGYAFFDQRSRAKLGFIAAPLVPALGGAATWLLTRFIVLAVIAGTLATIKGMVEKGARVETEQKFERMMADEAKKVREALQRRDQEVATKIEAIETHYARVVSGLQDANVALEQRIAATQDQPCWTTEVTHAIQDKAVKSSPELRKPPTKATKKRQSRPLK